MRQRTTHASFPALPGKRRLCTGLAILLLAATSALCSLAWLAEWRARQELERDVLALRAQVDDRRAREDELLARIGQLERSLVGRTQELAGERQRRLEVEQVAARHREALAALERRYRATLLELEAKAAEAASSQLQRAQLGAERDRLAARVRALEERLARAVAERDLARRNEKGLRWRIDFLEQRLATAESAQGRANGWLREWVGRQVTAIEAMLAAAGVDAKRLLERAGDEAEAGQGGPFEPAEGEIAAVLARKSSAPVDEPLLRLRAAQQLVARLPLSPPLDEFRLMSGYGIRRDPVTGARAIHRGLDFSAPKDARVLAPAPGRVIRAGREGEYGLLVAIDHGMGIVTVYGHLQQLLVRVGERVDFRQPIGIVGNTGRSTGRHLHYEIRVDGEPIDPAGLLEAGRKFVDVLKGQETRPRS
ncbi:Murein DD-endopeptidase MepM [bacterium HR40]|nr:Murein DD-endopeptidase MepM [bacterium HR40]